MWRFCTTVVVFSCCSFMPAAHAETAGPAVGSIAPEFKARNIATGD
jgi:hypothetical protein